MSRARGWIGLGILAIVVAAAILLWHGGRSAKEETEQTVASEVPVHVGPLQRATLHRYVVTFGTVDAEPARAGHPAAGARLAAPVAGLVASVSCTEGGQVKAGEVLVRLDTRVVDAQIAKAESAVKFAELAVARQRTMLAAEATSQKAFQEAEQLLAAASSELASARAERELLLVKAPLGGTVVRLNARAGDAVDANTVLAEIVNFERLIVSASVRSVEATLVKVGQRVQLGGRHPAGASEVVVGNVIFVGAQIDGKTDTVLVRIALPAGHGLKPGQLVDVRIVCEERANCLVVPEDAVVADGEGGSAIAIVEGDKATLRPVRLGLREDGQVEVLAEGLSEGTTIVTEGAYGLPKETKIKVVGK
jgi:membrane fusion protein, multidrug efflux system